MQTFSPPRTAADRSVPRQQYVAGVLVVSGISVVADEVFRLGAEADREPRAVCQRLTHGDRTCKKGTIVALGRKLLVHFQ